MSRIVSVIFLSLFIVSSHSIAADIFQHGYKFQDCRECPKMIVVRGDRFMMGSSRNEKGRDENEGPQHTVRIKKFAVGRFEVSNQEYTIFLNSVKQRGGLMRPWIVTNPESDYGEIKMVSKGKFKVETGKEKLPVQVSWYGAQAYVKWLSRKTGKQYRLLSEAEWEYVAGAKRSTAFWWGNSISTDQANYNGSFTYNGPKGKFRERTVPVNSFLPNPFGLYNVHGNIHEWVEDCWHENYQGAPVNGSAWLKANGGDCRFRVLRGGGWQVSPHKVRTRSRIKEELFNRFYSAGFRVAQQF